MSRASLFIPLGLFVGILCIGYIGFGLGDRQQLPSALVGKPFPEFSAALLKDPAQQISRADLIGKPTLVNVWATWCPTCLSEHNELMRIDATTDIVMVGVNYKDDRRQAIDWLARFGDPYQWVIEDADGLLGVELGVFGAPETFLLNAQGQVVYKRVGDINPRIWRDELAPRFAALGVSMTREQQAASVSNNKSVTR